MNESGGGGHFAGLILAVMGLVALVVWSTRKSTIQKLGARRVPVVIGAVLVLAAVGFFGNGSFVTSLRMVAGPSSGVPVGVTQRDVDAALAVATTPQFLAYAAALTREPVPRGLEKIGPHLRVRAATSRDVAAEGLSLSPVPSEGERWLSVNYEERENPCVVLVAGSDAAGRAELVMRLASDILPTLVAIEVLRAARTDEERLAAVRGVGLLVPHAAEWILRELERMRAGATPALAEALDEKIALTRRYVEDPTMRGLPAGTRLSAP